MSHLKLQNPHHNDLLGVVDVIVGVVFIVAITGTLVEVQTPLSDST